MTIVEFLHPLKGKPARESTLAVLYFEERYNQRTALGADAIRALLKQGRVPRAVKLNVADILAKSAPFVDVAGKKGKRFLWSLTEMGRERVRSKLGLPETDPEIEHDVSSLELLAAGITDDGISGYIREAIKCLSIGALRASVVFLWAGAVRKIQDDVFAHGAAAVTVALQRHDPKARNVKRVDDLAYARESTLLLAAQDLGVFDKNERGVLEEALNLRNKCGHPGKYSPGPKKVGSAIEDIVGVVFA